jgi:hypothetical protein
MQADTAAPIQSAPQQYSTPPSSYAAPVVAQQTAAQAPVATNSQWVAPYQPAQAPAPQMQAQISAAPYAPIQSYPQAQPTAENPYKEAFNRVVSLLSSPVQFPFQGQQSGATQGIDPASFSSQQSVGYSNNSAAPIYPSSQGYSPSSSQTSQEITTQQLLANGVSPESLEVIDHFGADAPAVLNNYACTVEDALIARYEQLTEAVNLLQELSQEHAAYEAILTDPDILADYTCEFFGPNGPYPVEEKQAQVMAMQQQQQAVMQPTGFDRPAMPVPPQPQGNVDTQNFWDNFGNVADRDPANAWRYLSMAQQNPSVFRQKLLVME